MGVKERRAQEKEGLRQEILEAARELFGEYGYQDVTIRRIAEKIEYSPTTIYLYFEDKDDLLRQICGETFAKLYATLEKLTSDKSSQGRGGPRADGAGAGAGFLAAAVERVPRAGTPRSAGGNP